ncbi:uncharacterized protein KY384_000349 [Bacidia gigantensis]|uniref:uncharacterized protein n=1 Tax=Bacidia gigantensis TaxID=2732470 RepID=UPI001D055847|nr:uncharacterized protein KY384_000349 [Bacidia gigantensis]KAG8526356.1 hypothetical protein KY384_000349 [Bacidia gigantensis]
MALLRRLLPVNPWKALAIILAVLNLKSLPLVWHLRLLRSLFAHIRISRTRLKTLPGPSTLFQPLITSSRSSPYECDYNLHKSNSTYFSDFDLGRLGLLVSLCGKGIDITRTQLREEMPNDTSGFMTALGGVAVNFRREIKPFEKFEVWTRILTWDRKWIYVIGHFVKPGSVKPRRYVLQPWKNSKSEPEDHEVAGADKKVNVNSKPLIFATAISKYVWKKGRLTIPPERILRASQLLPPKAEDHETPPTSSTPQPEGNSVDAANSTSISLAEKVTPDNASEVLAASLAPKPDSSTWSWQRIEDERLRGMKIAEMYGGLEQLNGEFKGEDGIALARS